MWDYIVLGQIPGTQLQVSFEMWLAISLLIAIGISVNKVSHSGKLRHALLALRVRHILQTAAYTEWLVTRRRIRA